MNNSGFGDMEIRAVQDLVRALVEILGQHGAVGLSQEQRRQNVANMCLSLVRSLGYRPGPDGYNTEKES